MLYLTNSINVSVHKMALAVADYTGLEAADSLAAPGQTEAPLFSGNSDHNKWPR